MLRSSGRWNGRTAALFAGEAIRLAYATEEAQEGRYAFLEKRPREVSMALWKLGVNWIDTELTTTRSSGPTSSTTEILATFVHVKNLVTRVVIKTAPGPLVTSES